MIVKIFFSFFTSIYKNLEATTILTQGVYTQGAVLPVLLTCVSTAHFQHYLLWRVTFHFLKEKQVQFLYKNFHKRPWSTMSGQYLVSIINYSRITIS